jgi:hypothetical protein
MSINARRFPPKAKENDIQAGMWSEGYTERDGGNRYRNSLAKRMDEALKRGGEFITIAKRLGTTTTALRVHIKDRVASGKWEFIATDGYDRGARFVATRGRLRRLQE